MQKVDIIGFTSKMSFDDFYRMTNASQVVPISGSQISFNWILVDFF